jgi:lipid II:glycine glycyltransferase (peptidoglycan interpeptide bridge formation enzyme)
MPDIRQTPAYAQYLTKIGWTVETNKDVNYFIKKLPLLGSVLKIQRPEKLDFKFIKSLGKKYHVFQTIIEPHKKLFSQHGFKQIKSTYLPSKTLILDLTKSEKEIFNNFQKDAKSAINKNKKTKVTEIKNLKAFRISWKKTVTNKRYVPPLTHLQALKESFKKKSLFLLDSDNSAGAIFLIGDKTGYYWQAFTNKDGRKKQKQYKIVWEGIAWAKKNKCKRFDFEGIYDERFPNKSWKGFSHFKKSFSGEEISYPGCFVKYNLFKL